MDPQADLKPATRPPRVSEKPDPKPVIPEGQPMLDEVPGEEDPDEKILSDKDASRDEEEPGDTENELPEGFTPLEH